MKFLLLGDQHIDLNKPDRRTDDYWETVKRKVRFVLDLKQKTQCIGILQPGDFFSSHRANDFLKRWVLRELRSRVVNQNEIMVITVFGQHDLRYHSSDTRNTPLSVLSASGLISIASKELIKIGNVHIYGTSWHEDIPKPISKSKRNLINILLMHKMVIKNEKLWDGQEDYKLGNVLLKSSGYDLIVAGDNHQHFTISTESGKHLVNCGSLLRTKIDQVHHTPLVYVYDTVDRSITPYEVPHEPFTKIFDMSKYEEEKVKDEKLEALGEKLADEIELEELDFVKILNMIIENHKDEIHEDTLDIIGETLE